LSSCEPEKIDPRTTSRYRTALGRGPEQECGILVMDLTVWALTSLAVLNHCIINFIYPAKLDPSGIRVLVKAPGWVGALGRTRLGKVRRVVEICIKHQVQFLISFQFSRYRGNFTSATT
jgi:hypothetical protein